MITIKAGIGALTGTLTTTGEAVQANGTGGGSDGGVVTMQAASHVTLAASSIEARGPNGNNTRGGTISVRSFNGAVTGNNGTGRTGRAAGGVGGSALGVVTLAACTLDPALSYTGTVTPAPAVINPAFPACTGAAGGADERLRSSSIALWTVTGGTASSGGGSSTTTSRRWRARAGRLADLRLR